LWVWGIWRVKKRFPRYGVPIWSLWPNIRCLPSIVAERNATKNGHIQNVCSMCIKINKVGKQEVGIWWVQKSFPRYGVPIWSLWKYDDWSFRFHHFLENGWFYRENTYKCSPLVTKWHIILHFHCCFNNKYTPYFLV
jgi:hypothetical protein